jgi:thiamine biosynthesis lipoprotein ApbE
MVRVGGPGHEVSNSIDGRRARPGHEAAPRPDGRDSRGGCRRDGRTRHGGGRQHLGLDSRLRNDHGRGGFDVGFYEHIGFHDNIGQLRACCGHDGADNHVGQCPRQQRVVVMGVQRESWRALGTGVHVLVSDGDITAASAAVRNVLADVDRTYSRFRPDSELSRINADSGRWRTISPLLADAIAAALRAAEITDGRVDPTVGRAMRAVGYDADFEQVRTRTDPISIRLEPIPGWQAIKFDRRSRTLGVARGVEIDLGSIGKALASDMAATAARSASGRGGVLVSLGGDIATAGDAPPGGWRVLVSEDSETPPDADGEVVALRDGGIATSGTTVRAWKRGDVALHHLIDPQTGISAYSPWRTASVVAASCVDANTAATAAIIFGASAPEWLEGLGLAARLVATDGGVLRIGSWPRAARVA